MADGEGEGEREPEVADTRNDVRAVYDEIADHFAQTREYPWPEVEDFLRDVPSGAVGLDVGCGNGRHAEILTRHVDEVIGLDASRGLLETANGRMLERDWTASLLQGDATALPLTDGVVDVGIYVATLHHVPSRDGRVRSLSELERVLAPEGRALVSAWSTAHDRFDADPDVDEGFDTTIDWTLPGGETVPRFYHIYAPAEFDADLERSGLAVEESFVSSGNCYAVVRPDGTPT